MNYKYDLFYSNIKNKEKENNNYENILVNSIKHNSIEYIFINKNTDYILNKQLHILNQLQKYNNYIDDIIKLNNFDSIKINNTTLKIELEIIIDDLFNLHKIKNIYLYIKKYINKNIKFIMNNQFDIHIYICKTTDDILISEKSFFYNIVLFLNELIKIKIRKIIYLYNFNSNIIKINNMINKYSTM